MNWNAIKFDWNQIKAFLATVEEGSFSAAAKALNLTQPTLSRQIFSLEAKLGLTLFERTKRSMFLTRSGHELLESVKEMSDAAMKISLIAAAQSEKIEGKITIAASDLISTFIFPRLYGALKENTANLDLDLITSNNVSNLSKRECDIAIQHRRPEQLDLIARLICTSSAKIYCSESYIKNYGLPKSLDEYSGRTFIGIQQIIDILPSIKMQGLNLSSSNFKIMTTSGTALVEMVKEGHGITILPDFVANQVEGLYCMSKEIVIEFPVWLVTHQEMRNSLKIKEVFNFLASDLRARVGGQVISSLSA